MLLHIQRQSNFVGTPHWRVLFHISSTLLLLYPVSYWSIFNVGIFGPVTDLFLDSLLVVGQWCTRGIGQTPGMDGEQYFPGVAQLCNPVPHTCQISHWTLTLLYIWMYMALRLGIYKYRFAIHCACTVHTYVTVIIDKQTINRRGIINTTNIIFYKYTCTKSIMLIPCLQSPLRPKSANPQKRLHTVNISDKKVFSVPNMTPLQHPWSCLFSHALQLVYVCVRMVRVQFLVAADTIIHDTEDTGHCTDIG